MARAAIGEQGRARGRQLLPLATSEAVGWAAGLLADGWAAVFLPQELARHGCLPLWRPIEVFPAPHAEPPAGTEGAGGRMGAAVRPVGAPPRRRGPCLPSNTTPLTWTP